MSLKKRKVYVNGEIPPKLFRWEAANDGETARFWSFTQSSLSENKVFFKWGLFSTMTLEDGNHPRNLTYLTTHNDVFLNIYIYPFKHGYFGYPC